MHAIIQPFESFLFLLLILLKLVESICPEISIALVIHFMFLHAPLVSAINDPQFSTQFFVPVLLVMLVFVVENCYSLIKQ